MLKKPILILFILLVCNNMPAFGQSLLWENVISKTSGQVHWDVAVGKTSIVALGNDSKIPRSSWLIFYDTSGNFVSEKKLLDSLNKLTFFEKMLKVKGENSFYVLGKVVNSLKEYLIKVDSAGDEIWINSDTYPALSDITNDMIQMKDKSVIFGGFRQYSGTGFDYYLRRVDSLGNTMWEEHYPKFGDQEIFSITEMMDGSIIVSGKNGGQMISLRVGFDGRKIDSTTYNTPSGNTIFRTASSVTPNNKLILSIENFNSNWVDNPILILDSNLNIEFTYLDDEILRPFIRINKDSTFYMYGFTEPDSSRLMQYNFPYQKISEFELLDSGDRKSPLSMKSSGTNKAILAGLKIEDGIEGDGDYWLAEIDGLSEEWIPDPCAYSPPVANFKYTYDYPLLTLEDSSYSGLPYHDTLYTWQWNTSIGQGGTGDSITIFYDTALNQTLGVELIVSNWYECIDTANITLNFGPNGVNAEENRIVRVFPNPVNNEVTFQMDDSSSDLKQIDIKDIHGRIVRSQVFNGKQTTLNIRSLQSGIYFYLLSTNKNTFKGKLVKVPISK